MILINSAAYVVSEFKAEFGQIPPCLLPLGNKKLLEFQVSLLEQTFGEQITVSLPANYILTLEDTRLLKSLNVDVVFVPVKLTLAEAILYVLNTVDVPVNSIKMLHGDTLIDHIPLGNDEIAVATTQDDYNWELEDVSPEREVVWCGYFSFSNVQALTKSLAYSNGDFVKAIRLYANDVPVQFSEVSGWHDLGHVNTYFISRSNITTQRVFNDLKISDGTVWKSGPSSKIAAESNWFVKLPVALRRYVPQLIDHGFDERSGKPYYMLEYLPCAPLNEVFVHGRNPDFYWKKVFGLMANFLATARTSAETLDYSLKKSLEHDANDLYRKKTFSRLSDYSEKANIDLDAPCFYDGHKLPSLRYIAQECIQTNEKLQVIPAVLHGDFCFSNILFDSRSDQIKVIDPRGINEAGEKTIWGDQKYDLAKACHSVIGLYDYIISGRYTVNTLSDKDKVIEFSEDRRIENIQNNFILLEIIPGIKTRDILPLTILLFLSMLPLHSDHPCRQEAMLLNALRLYSKFMIPAPLQGE